MSLILNGGVTTNHDAENNTDFSIAGNESSDNVSNGVAEVDSVGLLAASLSVDYAETPALNLDGTVRKKRGRKPGQKNGEKAPTIEAPKKTASEIQAQKLTAEQTARLLLNTSVGVMVELVGPEWDFDSPEEAAMLKTSVAAYIESKGGAQLSPELILLLAVSSYALPRARHSNTRIKLANFAGKTWAKLTGVFKRKPNGT